MSHWPARWISTTLLILIASTQTWAQQEDVTFFVIGKHANFDQLASGDLEAVDFSFFAEIFLTSDGDAENAFMHTPTGETIRFRDQRLVDGPDKDNLLLISGAKRFTSYAELQSWYPDGGYKIEFDTDSGSVSNGSLSFPQNGLPQPPRVTLQQNGSVLCGAVNPDQDLEVHWSRFAQGGADENGILDDLIFVILEDDTGKRVSHSGRPFENRPYLTFADSSHTISASVLEPGMQYKLGVEHALLTDTRAFDTIPAMTTYAVTTNVRFRVAEAAPGDCSTEAIKEADRMRPTIDEQVVMLYYKNLAAADRFYGGTLGLEKTLDEDWVKFYRTSATSTIGLVAEGEGAWHQVQDRNAVMISIVTSEVDAWYQLLRKRDEVKFLKEIGDGSMVRSFLLEDPGGYTVEFFEWTRTSAQ